MAIGPSQIDYALLMKGSGNQPMGRLFCFVEMANQIDLDIQAGKLYITMNEPLKFDFYNYSLAFKNSEIEKESEHSKDVQNGFFNENFSTSRTVMNLLEFSANPFDNPKITTKVEFIFFVNERE